jgi:hypothetical protein
MNWPKVEFLLAYKLHISPIELDSMDFYRIEYLLKEYEDYVNKENEEYEKQKSEQSEQQQAQSYSLPKYEMPKMALPSSSFKMPSMPSFSK